MTLDQFTKIMYKSFGKKKGKWHKNQQKKRWHKRSGWMYEHYVDKVWLSVQRWPAAFHFNWFLIDYEWRFNEFYCLFVIVEVDWTVSLLLHTFLAYPKKHTMHTQKINKTNTHLKLQCVISKWIEWQEVEKIIMHVNGQIALLNCK